MTRTESGCVDCQLPCIRSNCEYYRVQTVYCDSCDEKAGYRIDGEDCCEECANYVFDDDEEEYVCCVSMDEDDYIRLNTDSHFQCPYYQCGDEYKIVRHQM